MNCIGQTTNRLLLLLLLMMMMMVMVWRNGDAGSHWLQYCVRNTHSWLVCRGVDCQVPMDDLGHQVYLGWMVFLDGREPVEIRALEVKTVCLARVALPVDQVWNVLIVFVCVCMCVFL